MVETRLIDGKASAAALRARVAAAAAELKARHAIVPGLAAVLVGDDPASEVYVRSKGKATREAGLASIEHRLPATTGAGGAVGLVATLNADPAIDGILVQLPLPPQIEAQRVIEAIDPAKDVDGFHPQQCRAAVERRHGAGAVHALWLPDAAARDAGQPRRRRGGGARPLQYRRQADGGAAAGRELHRGRRAFEDPRPAGAGAARRHPGRGGRPRRAGARRLDQARRHGDRCRHQPRRRRRRQEPRWSATSPSPKRRAWRARSRRCRAASGR